MHVFPLCILYYILCSVISNHFLWRVSLQLWQTGQHPAITLLSLSFWPPRFKTPRCGKDGRKKTKKTFFFLKYDFVCTVRCFLSPRWGFCWCCSRTHQQGKLLLTQGLENVPPCRLPCCEAWRWPQRHTEAVCLGFTLQLMTPLITVIETNALNTHLWKDLSSN